MKEANATGVLLRESRDASSHLDNGLSWTTDGREWRHPICSGRRRRLRRRAASWFGDTGDMWVPLAEALVKDHMVIVPDLRGMGLSSHPEGGYEKTAQARDLSA